MFAETCNQSVLAGRDKLKVPAGSSLSLSCQVRHCGNTWNGTWMWTNSTEKILKAVEESVRHHLARVPLSDNETQLILNFLTVDQSDEGFYSCRVIWGQGEMEQGHFTSVGVTAGV